MDISELININRIDSSILARLLLILYLPMGIVCFTVRLLISLQYTIILSVLPKPWYIRRFLLRVYFSITGLIITVGGKEPNRKGTKLVVSNHVSCLDSLVMEAVEPLSRISNQADLPPILGWLFGFCNMNPKKTEILPIAQSISKEQPYACFPEEESTNGSGLLKFTNWLSKLDSDTLQPVILYTSRYSFSSVKVSYMESTVWSDIFWVLFLPFTHFHIGYLPAKDLPQEESGKADTIEQARQDMALVLKVSATNLTAQDKRDTVKRYRTEQSHIKSEPRPRAPSSQQLNNSLQLNRMVEQVKAVMPQVPSHVIKADIVTTTSVDQTLANLLDGTLSFSPLTEEEQKNEKANKNEIILKASNSVFATSSNERHFSFQQRKEITIQNARVRYLERHPGYEPIG